MNRVIISLYRVRLMTVPANITIHGNIAIIAEKVVTLKYPDIRNKENCKRIQLNANKIRGRGNNSNNFNEEKGE